MKVYSIVPTYNEAENLPKLVSAFFALPIQDLNLLIVDDNSPDGTGQLAEDLCKTYPGLRVMHRTGKQGLGTAYIAGFRRALDEGADLIGQMDADFSHPLDKVPELVAAAERADITIGSRYVAGGSLDKDWPLWRKQLSSFGNFYARTILNMPMRDCTGGFRMWRRKVIETMPLDQIRANGYVFQVETAYVAHRMGFTFAEIPIYFAERRLGQSKMSLKIQIEAALRVWQLLGRYRNLKRVV